MHLWAYNHQRTPISAIALFLRTQVDESSGLRAHTGKSRHQTGEPHLPHPCSTSANGRPACAQGLSATVCWRGGIAKAYLPGTGAYDRERGQRPQLSTGGCRSRRKGKFVGITLSGLAGTISFVSKRTTDEKYQDGKTTSEKSDSSRIYIYPRAQNVEAAG